MDKKLVSPHNPKKQVQLKIAKYSLIYSIFGLLVSLSCIVGGVFLFLNGVVGSTSWAVHIFEMNSNITDAAPGAILFIVGVCFALITRYKLHVD